MTPCIACLLFSESHPRCKLTQVCYNNPVVFLMEQSRVFGFSARIIIPYLPTSGTNSTLTNKQHVMVDFFNRYFISNSS